MLSRSHIRIDTVYVRVRSRLLRALLDLLSLGCMALFSVLLAWHGWGVVQLSYVSNSHSQSAIEMPLAIPQAAWFAGLVFFVAVALLLLVRSLIALRKAQLDEVFRLIGSKSSLAEVKEEIVAIEHAFEAERKP